MCIKHYIAFLVSVEHHVDMMEYVGGILYSFTYIGYGTSHITVYPSDFCISPCQIDIRTSLKKSFVLATFMAPRSSNIDAVHVPSHLCAIVSLTALQGQGYSRYHISVRYCHVVDFDLLLRKCRHCRNIFVKGSVETSWPCSLQFRILLGSKLGSTVQRDSCKLY